MEEIPTRVLRFADGSVAVSKGVSIKVNKAEPVEVLEVDESLGKRLLDNPKLARNLYTARAKITSRSPKRLTDDQRGA